MVRRLVLFIFILGLFPRPAVSQNAPLLDVQEVLDLDNKIDQVAETESDVKVTKMEAAKDSEFATWPERLYIDPDLDAVKITSIPGYTWRQCAKNRSLCVSVNEKTEITRITTVAPLTRKETNPATGELEDKYYIQVKYKIGSEEKTGWIETSSLRKEQLKAIYHQSDDEDGKPCPEKDESHPLKPTQNQKDIAAVSKAIAKNAKAQLDASTAAVRDLVGQCPLVPSNKKKENGEWDGRNIYDNEVLPRLKKQSSKFPEVLREGANGQAVSGKASLQDILAIDALARTVYSEMGSCVDDGIQYPMAVAKVALNRAKKYQESPKLYSRFVGSPNSDSKPALARVVTAGAQFDVWNSKSARNPKNKTILMSLCPMRDPDSKKNWNGSIPTPDDSEAWSAALKIATEAVLFPKRFEAKTSEVTQIDYRSGMDRVGGLKRASPAPKIMGRPVDLKRCMYLFEEK